MTDLTPGQALAQPVSITLGDGTTAALRYTFRSMALLEQRFGSVQAIQTAIDQSGDGAAFGPLMELIGAGLVGKGGFTAHVRHRQDVSGRRTVEEILYKRSSDGIELGDGLLDLARITEYAAAMSEAFTTALGSGTPGNGGAQAETVSPGLT